MAVYGRLEDLLKHDIITGRVKAGLEYLATLKVTCLMGKEEGYRERIDLDGDNLYVLHQVYTTRHRETARFEAHRHHIDLQMVWHGEEFVTVAGLPGLKTLMPYDNEKDIEFFEYFLASDLLLVSGWVGVLYPYDAHAPSIATSRPALVKKTVVKVRV